MHCMGDQNMTSNGDMGHIEDKRRETLRQTGKKKADIEGSKKLDERTVQKKEKEGEMVRPRDRHHCQAEMTVRPGGIEACVSKFLLFSPVASRDESAIPGHESLFEAGERVRWRVRD
mmetsp:Transcript_27100/g.53206  ORF Transcript_27100/g.53206 Transcript_27100/m.53206 type:complete len:117 (+) Transcript_27100:188-538(+)